MRGCTDPALPLQKVLHPACEKHTKAGSICVEIKYYDFQSVSRQTQIDIPTNSTDLITQTSKRLFHELWNQQPVRLLGIRTTKLVDENEPVQLSLFDLDFSDISANKTNANADFPKNHPRKNRKTGCSA